MFGVFVWVFILTCWSPIHFQLVCQSLFWCSLSVACLPACSLLACFSLTVSWLNINCYVSYFSVTHLFVTHGCSPLVGFLTFLLLHCSCYCMSVADMFLTHLFVTELIGSHYCFLLTCVAHFFGCQICAAHLFVTHLFVPHFFVPRLCDY